MRCDRQRSFASPDQPVPAHHNEASAAQTSPGSALLGCLGLAGPVSKAKAVLASAGRPGMARACEGRVASDDALSYAL